MDTDSWFVWFWDLMPGLWTSLQLTVAMLAFGLPLSVLMALGSKHPKKYVSYPVTVVIEVCRGIPALVLLYIVYFGFPEVGMQLTAFVSSAVALGASFASYCSAAVRAGIEAVPSGQSEASVALGLRRSDRFFRVIMPQAVRIVIPPVIGWAILYFQATSLAFAIAVPELISRAFTLASQNLQYFSLLAIAAIIYAAISIPFSLFSEYLSQRKSRQGLA